MLNIAPYIAKYVRSLHAHQEDLLIPYTQTQFGVVLMVDVVGFSTLTTMAAEKGDSGAEAIALEIGSYMGECIEIIEHYGGDVVKFLGDAVLVSFQPDGTENDPASQGLDPTSEVSIEVQLQQWLVRRAVECGQQLLARQSHYRVYLTAEERSKHRSSITGEIERRSHGDNAKRFFLFDGSTSGSDPPAGSPSLRDMVRSKPLKPGESAYAEEYSMKFSLWNCLPLVKNRKNRVYARRTSVSSDGSGRDLNSIDLELHIALSCGDVTNIILGDLDASASVSSSLALVPFTDSAARYSWTAVQDGAASSHSLSYTGRLEYAICGPVIESLEAALSAAKAGEMCITPDAYELITAQSMALVGERRESFFIVKNDGAPTSATQKTTTSHRHRRGKHFGKSGVGAHRTTPKEPTQTPATSSALPSAHTSLLDLSKDADDHYFKYINRSALYRLQHSADENFPPQFRDATIVFISLGKLNATTPTGIKVAQKAVYITIQTLIKYEGMLQQFAVDDKGATLLAIFGLPPLSHEREAVFAAKAAIELREQYSDFLHDFSIALSTGTIIHAVLPQGNPYRRDAGIAGDTIILAVRMLKFPFAKRKIVCDFATKHQIGAICDFEDFGVNFVKGKVKPVPIYGILKFGAGKMKRIALQDLGKSSDFIGYKAEMHLATHFLDGWCEAPNHHVLIISGPSGVGKSFFCHALSKTMTQHGATCCWSSSTEVERGTKYYLMKNVLLSLFEVIDSEKVPQNVKKRTSQLNASMQSHLHGSFHSSHTNDGSQSSSVSSARSPASKERFRQIKSHSSVARSWYGANAPGAEGVREVVELIHRCLRKCGEDEGFLPLFKVVFAALGEMEENKYTQRLDSRGRDILLTSVITRMARYVSEHVGLVFICDDVQWADSASVRILQHIHEHCQRVMLLLATRPIRDYNVTFINSFCEAGVSEEIGLNGLGAGEIGDIILRTVHSGVHKVSAEIVRVIQKRTAGNPLYVKNMAIILKDFNHVTVMDGELVPSSSSFDLEDLLGNFDYKRVIKMQFDRLDANFQEFLTVASCLDQHFSIYEVQAVIKPNNVIFQDLDPVKISEAVRRLDVYNFLHQVADNPLELMDEVFAFAHATIPQCIYDMMSYEARILLHRLLARYYERQLTRESYPELLGKVTRHYLQTDWLDKQLYYLEALADLNMGSYLLPEATTNLERIVRILNENEEAATRFGRIHRSDIYRRLGMCFTMRTKLKEGERYLFKALECLGEPWPRSEPEFLYRFWLHRFTQYKRRKCCMIWQQQRSNKRRIIERVVEIMTQLSNIYFYTGKGRAFVYTCLVGLNACESLGQVGSAYTLFLARNALLCWMNDKKHHSIFYITKALRHIDEKNDAGTFTICAMLCFAAGKFQEARNLLYRSIDAVKTLGAVTDCQSFYRSIGLVVTMRIFEGTLDSSRDDLVLLKQMADTAHSNGDYEAEIWLGVYHIGNALIMNRPRDCEPFVALLEAHLKQAADYNRIAIHGTLLFYYARIQDYEAARRHTRSLVHILPTLTMTPNTFPIFGLIFATMGLYCMVEDEQVDLVSTHDTANFHRFIHGLARINHAFQHVKFWEFTQPCLYLARALPYISTGRTVEGFLVLRHGIYEMHFIQEIRFLKAYYWANLGKYAFTPTDRIDWTRRAREDLDDLHIPSQIYINPDPARLYSQCLPADLSA